MSKSSDIVIELLRVYNSLAEQLFISADLGRLLHDLKDIRSGGNEIEIAVRNTLAELLPTRYNVSQGHIIDKMLTVSKQYDLVISENFGFGSILKTKDHTELFFYETIFAIGEIKATWERKTFKSAIDSIRQLKTNLNRKKIDSRAIISGSQEIRFPNPITQLPYRNPLFCFAIAIKGKELNKLKGLFTKRASWVYLPNIIVVLDAGIFVLVKTSDLNERKLTIKLYPEFSMADPDCEWRFISNSEGGKNLAYLLFCLHEHLANTIIEKPPFLQYSAKIIDVDDEDLISLDDL